MTNLKEIDIDIDIFNFLITISKQHTQNMLKFKSIRLIIISQQHVPGTKKNISLAIIALVQVKIS